MKQTKILMGMPITVEIVDDTNPEIMNRVFDYFREVDRKFSPFKSESEVSKLNRGETYSEELSAILKLCEETKKATNGYFDIKKPDGSSDPSGLVKGWAIYNASQLLAESGIKQYYIEAGGDIQASGKIWKVGIKNPFKSDEIVKVLFIEDRGVATSGTYERGKHIYNPHKKRQNIDEIVSLTVVGPNIYEADRFATAAFAMGREAINFIEKLSDFEGYMIDNKGIATMTSGFEKYTHA
jgi:thiamine biosynthesis lipoprotein